MKQVVTLDPKTCRSLQREGLQCQALRDRINKKSGTGSVAAPRVAYLYFTTSTGGLFEQTVSSNLGLHISAPPN
jgi:phage-related baseplate assembly protein